MKVKELLKEIVDDMLFTRATWRDVFADLVLATFFVVWGHWFTVVMGILFLGVAALDISLVLKARRAKKE